MSRPIYINTSSAHEDRGKNERLFVYVSREGDRERILEFYQNYASYSDEKLIESYNQNRKTGVVGVHAQGLGMIAMHHVFLRRWGSSPFHNEENIIWGFTTAIALTASGWQPA